MKLNLIKAVYNSIKKKRSIESEAGRLGISVELYNEVKDKILNSINYLNPSIEDLILKNVIAEEEGEDLTIVELLTTKKITHFDEDLEKGTGTYKCITSVKPRTPEEIIQILDIDTTKWKLSQYWNKEVSGKWLVSALVTKKSEIQVGEESFLSSLNKIDMSTIKPLSKNELYINNSTTEKVCGIISLQDLHFGKPGNEDMEEVMMKALSYLIGKAYNNYTIEKLILVVGSDTLNMDTFNGTTTSGTIVENSESATTAYLKAFDAICKGVILLKQYCKNLEVVFIPGNHDRLSSFHLLHAVSQAFSEMTDITFNVDYEERKVIRYGKNMLCFEHGDVSSKNNPLIFATEYSKIWGLTLHRVLYTGHYHGRKNKEFITENELHGFVSRVIPALTSSDYWHHHNKFVGNKRAAILHIHDSEKGLVSEFVYNHNI